MTLVSPAPMKIFYMLGDVTGCGTYRCILPGTALAKMGHEVTIGAQMPIWVREGAMDVIVAQRACLPGITSMWQNLARAGHTKLVFEIDDDLWHVDPSNKGAYAMYVKGEVRENGRRVMDAPIGANLIDNIRVSDLVTVTTEPLADLVSAWNPNVVVLPNMIPADLLDRPPREPQERVTIGWGGSPTHNRDFGEIAKPLRRVLQRFGAATEFHCMGADYTPRVQSPRGRTRFSGWFDTVGDYMDAIDFDAGLAPLRATTFNESKSDIKLLELAALGIPALVSNTGPYRRAFDAGAPCRVFDDARGFESLLVELIQSPADRVQLGKEAREWASTRTIEGNGHLWESAYRSG